MAPLATFRITHVADTLDFVAQRVLVAAAPEDSPAGSIELWLTEEAAEGLAVGDVLEVAAAVKVSTARACCATGACGSFES